MRDRHVFMWQSVEVLTVFNTSTLKQIFWKTKTFCEKLEYRLLVESTKIENTPTPYKIVMSESNVNSNRMVSTKLTFHSQWSFASNYFIFLKILFQFKNFLQRVDLMYQKPKCPYTFWKRWSFNSSILDVWLDSCLWGVLLSRNF